MKVFLLYTDTPHGIFVTCVYKTREGAIRRIELDGYTTANDKTWFKKKNGKKFIRFIVEEEVKD